jgi:hypothetical protein
MRGIPYADTDIEVVRQYVQGRAFESSVRAVAATLGIPHTSLEKFLDGSEPYTKNRIKLCEFYLREHRTHPVRTHSQEEVEGPAEDLSTHLEALLSELRGEARSEARMRITTALAQAYRRMGEPDPEWLFARR